METKKIGLLIKEEIKLRLKNAFGGRSEQELVRLLKFVDDVAIEPKKRKSNRVLASAYTNPKLGLRIEYGHIMEQLTDNCQAEIFRHEFLHIVSDIHYKEDTGHGMLMKCMAVKLGYDRELASGTIRPVYKAEYIPN